MRSIKKNFLYQFAYQVVNLLLPLITAPYVSRALGAESIGTYTYASTVSYYFWVVAMLGFETHGQRRIAGFQTDREKRSKLFFEIYTLQIIITVIVSLAYFGYALTLTGLDRQLGIIQIVYMASSCVNVVWLFEGVEEFKSVSIRNIVVKIVSTILIFLLVKSKDDLWLYALIIAGSTFGGCIILLVEAHKYVEFTKIKFSNLKLHVWPIIRVFLPQIGITIFMQMDKLMLGWWSTPRQLGYYQNGERIVNIPVTLILTIGNVIMPRIAKLRAEGDTTQIKRYNKLSMEALLLFGVACTTGLIAISKDFTPWFFGEDFRNSADVVSLLSVQIVFMAWENVLQKQYLTPMERDKVVIFCMSMAAAINLVLNSILIPRYAAIGAIIASLISHLFICVWESIILCKEQPITFFIKVLVEYSILGIIMCVIVMLIGSAIVDQNLTVKVIVEITTGVVVYIALALAMLKHKKSELLTTAISSVKNIKGRFR